jgi:hypothetical protein
MLVAKRAVIRGHTHAVVRVRGRLHLVDQVANRERMFLRGAKNKYFLLLVDRVHEQFDAIFFALLDLDDAVEIVLGVTPAFLDLALDQLVIGGVDVMIERGGDLLDLKGSQIAVIDPFLEGIDVNRLSEIGVGINICPALWASRSARAARRARNTPECHASCLRRSRRPCGTRR